MRIKNEKLKIRMSGTNKAFAVPVHFSFFIFHF